MRRQWRRQRRSSCSFLVEDVLVIWWCWWWRGALCCTLAVRGGLEEEELFLYSGCRMFLVVWRKRRSSSSYSGCSMFLVVLRRRATPESTTTFVQNCREETKDIVSVMHIVLCHRELLVSFTYANPSQDSRIICSRPMIGDWLVFSHSSLRGLHFMKHMKSRRDWKANLYTTS